MKNSKILRPLKIVIFLISIFALKSALAQTACIDTTSAQTITGSDTANLVALSNTEWNVGMTVDQTGYSKIVVPSDGLYRITGSISYYNIPDGKHAHVGIALNGSYYSILSCIHSGAATADSLIVNGTTVLNLTANSAISLVAQSNVTSVSTYSGIGCKLVVEKIPNGRLTACLNTTSAQSVTGPDVDVKATLSNVAWNIGMTVNTTNSTITVPTSGRYRITGYASYLNLPDGKHAHLGVNVNGAAREYLQVVHAGAATADSLVLSGSTVLTLAANDVVNLHLQHCNSSSVSTISGIGCQLIVESAD